MLSLAFNSKMLVVGTVQFGRRYARLCFHFCNVLESISDAGVRAAAIMDRYLAGEQFANFFSNLEHERTSLPKADTNVLRAQLQLFSATLR